MIDIHCHILPGVDDGPATLEEAVEMARLAYADGTQAIVATPHNRDVAERSSLSAMRELTDRLNKELQANAIPLKVLLGMENHLEMDTPAQVDRRLAVPIERTRYILMELPSEFYPFYAEEVLFNLQMKGLLPMIVHPERNLAIQGSIQILANLVQKGLLVQVTAESITGALGKDSQKTARELLQRNLVHIIASDGHAAQGARRPLLSAGVAAAAGVVGEEVARKMVTVIPEAILQNRKPDLDGLVPKTSKGRWWNPRR